MRMTSDLVNLTKKELNKEIKKQAKKASKVAKTTKRMGRSGPDMEFWGKVDKVFGAVGDEAVGATQLGAAGVGAVNKAANFVSKHSHKIKRSEAADLFELVLPYRLNARTTVVGVGGILAVAGANETFKMHNKSKIGNIGDVEAQPGVSIVRDDVLSQVEDKSVKGLSNHGATGDIVFALHNMRR